MGNKEGDKGESPIGTVKAVGGFYMVFKGAVESFDELLVGAVGFGLTVEILESDHLAVL